MKRKLNIKAVWSLISLIAGSYFVIDSFYQITIKPFISNRLTAFTPLGLCIFIISLFVMQKSGEYLYERANKKR